MPIEFSESRFGSIASCLAKADVPFKIRRQLLIDLLMVLLSPYPSEVEDGMFLLLDRTLDDAAADAAASTVKLDGLPMECTFRKDAVGFWVYSGNQAKGLGYGLTPREAFDHRWEYESQAREYLLEHSADCAVKSTE